MPSTIANSENPTEPMPKFRFEVDLGDKLKSKMSFQEVSGLDAETQVIEYRKGDSPQFSAIKMPGIAKFGNVTMRKGILTNDHSFWYWLSEIKMNIIKRRTIFIRLLDETGNTAIQWQLNNAWPKKITSTDLKSDGNEITIETIEFAYENLAISMK